MSSTRTCQAASRTRASLRSPCQHPSPLTARFRRTNHVEVGTNDKVTQLAAQKIIHAKFRVPLLPREANFHSLQVYPPLSSLEVYTMQHQALEHVDLFPRGTEHVESFDKCTMIMTVYSRVETFLDRIEHYHTLDRLGQILIVWNNVDYPPPAISSDDYNIPVEILKMERNSLNNRFHPWPQIKYSCVINMVRYTL